MSETKTESPPKSEVKPKAAPPNRSAATRPKGVEQRKVDAVLIPKGFGGPGRAVAQHARVNALFGPLAGVQSFWWSQQGGQNLGIPNTGYQNYASDLRDCSLLFPASHPLSRGERYEWFIAEQGDDGRYHPTGYCEGGHRDCPELPKLGYRRADPAEGDPALIKTAAEHQAEQAEFRRALLRTAISTPELYERLKRKLGVSDAEMEVMFAHVDRIDV